ncbi:[NiFe] hydrogenase nickel incorporation-associated protein HypB [Labilithrix luteola]|uniref:[NiFe] hydrogenase nickel incorporation-associated protein HypB n=1 Tax=Labilithrix luteola TaxID=1391654 RepID=A0A0K1QCC0_9BACT|nr:hydrogenase nickel incorporation protein HypB [Labilithrix luteola]AKV03373.1 [NiFe] hydrogenase nickel incorporation-associated protein HypB [Labilithrix luteola]
MCATCGCSSDGKHEHHDHGEHGHHRHDHDGHSHGHTHGSTETRRIRLEHEVLAKNDALARENRAWLAGRKVKALNLLGSPGAGKTTLLEASIRALRGRLPVSVLEGDQETEHDAARIRATGARAIQINTGTVCHLDAHVVGHALEELDPPSGSLVVVENVGNLVCPALFDVGEHAKVVVLSVTEGDDKPLKYPHVFRASQVLVVSKVDLLPHVPFDLQQCVANALAVNPALKVFAVSATTGQGLDHFCAWLLQPPGNDAA